MECKKVTLRYLEANGYYPITEELLVGIPKERHQLYMKYDYVKFRDGQPYFYSKEHIEKISIREIEKQARIREESAREYIKKTNRRMHIKKTLFSLFIMILSAIIGSAIGIILFNLVIKI